MDALGIEQGIINAGDRLAEAVETEMRLEDERALVKDAAIKRLMAQHGMSATAAEKVVEQDAAYHDHLATKRAATVAKIKARAYYEVCIARARMAAGYAEVL